MKRPALNFTVDLLAFVGFALLAATGLVLNFALPPGSGGPWGAGPGPGAAQRPVALLWGLTRHEWGRVHFWTAVALMSVLAVHLFLHWRWIACMAKGQPRARSGFRLALGMFGLLALAAFAASLFLSPVRKVPRSQLWQERGAASAPEAGGGRGRAP